MGLDVSSFEYLGSDLFTISIEEAAPASDLVFTSPLPVPEAAPAADAVLIALQLAFSETAPATDSVLPTQMIQVVESAPSYDSVAPTPTAGISFNEFSNAFDSVSAVNSNDLVFGMSIFVSNEFDKTFGSEVRVQNELDDTYGTQISVGAPLLVAVTSLTGGNGVTRVAGQNPLHPIVAVNGAFVTTGDGTFTPPSLTGTQVLVVFSINNMFDF